MSYGLTPYDFVQQVYYAQEKVRLDFRPDDDKYKEVLLEANLVLQELQNAEDWSWLRDRLVLGPTFHDPHRIPDYELPEWVYKPSTVFGDCLKLYRVHDGHLDETAFIPVYWASDGTMAAVRNHDVAPWTEVQAHSVPLHAYFYGNTVTFNRPLTPYEGHHRMAVCDVQRRIKTIHICNDDCPRDDKGNCQLIEDRILTEIPDPNYVIMQTAARHAAGSPPAQHMMAELTDAATRILSAMRNNDVSHTAPDIIPREDLSWIGVM